MFKYWITSSVSNSMWLEETINNLWEAGIKDNNLALIYKFNEKVKVAVKSPFGLTERKIVKKRTFNEIESSSASSSRFPSPKVQCTAVAFPAVLGNG